jgi:hypothetical protein
VRPPAVLAPALALALLLTACGAGDEEARPTTPPTTASAPAPVEPGPEESEGGTGSSAELPADLRGRPEVARAIADAASRQDVPEARVAVAAWTPVTWNSGSLGCPQPGRAYTQALVDGWLLLLRVDTALLAYHAGPDGAFGYCAEPDGTFTVRGA